MIRARAAAACATCGPGELLSAARREHRKQAPAAQAAAETTPPPAPVRAEAVLVHQHLRGVTGVVLCVG